MSRQATLAITAFFVALGTASSFGQKPTPQFPVRGGRMMVDVAGVVGRSDIILQRPNLSSKQTLPLGNGRLGVAVWSEAGFSAQLNRSDTLPRRYSPGQVQLPGLAAMTTAPDYSGRLNLYNGTFEEHGGGISLKAYVQPVSDLLVIDVAGADPATPQTAILTLWEPRKPQVRVEGAVGILAESWVDNEEPGASGLTFGSLSAITAVGREVSVSASGERTITVTLKPTPDGRFRILVASPSYKGETERSSLKFIRQILSASAANAHIAFWNNFWHKSDLMKISSSDGSGEYMENLRAIYLYSAAAENGGDIPGSQAGEADLFSAARDQHQWDPGAFWHWNLRMQVAANLGAGVPELNTPYFRLYRDNLANLEKWTHDRIHGAPGICIPETMRFNGNGIEFELWGGNTTKVTGWNCDAASGPYYNARTLTTGAEVSLWIWEQYLATGDKQFLATNFPIMAESARFLTSYEKPGPDGLLHTAPSNAHETQWDVTDPTTDLAARAALYTATLQAADVLHQEPALAAQLRSDLSKIPKLPRVSANSPGTLLTPGHTAADTDHIADSYLPAAEIHNVENIGLEPLWPYAVIGDSSADFALARRTYLARPNKYNPDWSFDAVDAARLGVGEEVRSALIAITAKYQTYINGFNEFSGQNGEFYVEQSALVALALQEALVQDYDGTIRIAPAIPSAWDFDGSVSVRGGIRVDVQARHGVPVAVGLTSKIPQQVRIRNPWPGQLVTVTAADTGMAVPAAKEGGAIVFILKAATAYLMQSSTQAESDRGFKPVEGSPATSPKTLRSVHIGLLPHS